MCNVIKIPYLVLCSLILLLTSVNSYAGIEPHINRKTAPFAIGDTMKVSDDKFLNPNINWSTITNNSVKAAITLRVSDNIFIRNSFTYSVTYDVKYYTDPDTITNAPVTLTNKVLTVNYTTGSGTTYKGTDSYVFSTAVKVYRMIVTVRGVTTDYGTPVTTPIVELSSSLVIDRTYSFNASSAVPMSFVQDTTKIVTNWNPVIGAEEYDLEWTTINNGNLYYDTIRTQHTITAGNHGSIADTASYQATLNRAFRNNSTRITTSENSYTIPILTTDDYMLVRIRQIQYANGIRKAGDWYYRPATDFAIFDIKWHQPTLNWQYSAAFAEEGKKKEVIGYFDGTLRGRQTVTVNSSDSVELVQENVYDEFGRAGASILPAPKHETVAPYLHYVRNFNLNASNKAYNFANLADTAGTNCEWIPDALNTVNGSAKYYSIKNAFDTVSNVGYRPFNKYAPNAGGYPLSVMQYTADNTGRIKLQGGVGPDFQPGKGPSGQYSRTTKYFYGKPEQWELDQLFGNDVGFAEHYTKNMVLDPNGQVSVSYLNASGKTIATALAGLAPSSLDTLTGSNTQHVQSIVVLKPSQFVYDASALKLTASTTYLAAVTGSTPFKINLRKLVDNYPGGSFQICSNCYYNMKVKITNDCGDTVAYTANPVQIGSALSNPADTGAYQALISPTPVFNRVGEYYISVELAFDNDVINSYTDNFITQSKNSGYLEQQFGYIKKRYLDTLDASEVFGDCQTCSQLLGQRADFIQSLKDKFFTLNVDTTSVTNAAFAVWADSLYTVLKNKCTAMQATCDYAPCNSTQDLMLNDVSPGGQYALFDNDGNPMEPEINVIARADSASVPNWKAVFPTITDTASTVYKSQLITRDDGSITSVYALSTVNELVKYWKPEWGIRFLKYHPEYCRLQFCMNNTAVENWDERVKQTDLASDVPSIPGAGSITFTSGKAADWLMAADPAFQSGGVLYSSASQMRDNLLYYSTDVLQLPTPQFSSKSLTGVVDYLLYAADTTSTTNLTNTGNRWANCNPNPSCRVLDREWVSYRNYYFQLKQKYYDNAINAICQNTGACAIGTTKVGGGVTGTAIGSVSSGGGGGTGGTSQPVYFRITDEQVTADVPCSADGTASNYRKTTIWLVDTTGTPVTVSNNQNVSLTYNVSPTSPGGHYGMGVDFAFRDSVSYTYQSASSPDLDHVYGCGAHPMFLSCINQVSSGMYMLTTNSSDFTTACSGVSIPVYTPSDTTPPPSACDTWASKVPRFPAYANNLVPSDPGAGEATAGQMTSYQATAMINDIHSASADSIAVSASANADHWMLALDSGFRAIADTNYRKTKYNALRAELIAVSQAGADSVHIFGSSDLAGDPSPGISTYKSFGEAIKGVIALPNYTDVWNPWLIDSPYPYKTPMQVAERQISKTDPDLCSKLSRFNTAAAAAGVDLYTYLHNTFKDNMVLTTSEVADLQNACGNCKFLLAKDITVPVFLEKSARGFIHANDYLRAIDTLNSKFTAPLNPNGYFYQTILTNFMNQRFGFALNFEDYSQYSTVIASDTTALLCNKRPYSSMKIDPYGSLKSAMVTAVNNGIEDYASYIQTQRDLFRNSYLSVCKLANPSATLTTNQRLYHYTLYYYDQADNLVRTVPPEGVRLLDSTTFAIIDTARAHDSGLDCQSTYNIYKASVIFNNKTAAFNDVSANISSSTGKAMDFWLSSPAGQPNQVIEQTPDGNYLFQVCMSGTKLVINIYSSPVHSSASVTYSLSNQFAANIPAASSMWSHLVLQGSNLATGAMTVYLNGKPLPALSGTQQADCSWTVTAGATSITYPDDISTVKHLRIYNRILTSAEIQAGAADECMMPCSQSALTAWYRFNSIVAGDGSNLADNAVLETAVTGMYPAHAMRTSYAYNATNQVVKQNSPDGGTNRYWYDILSRLNVSQNDKQLPANLYSYTKYDTLGRITEVGQKNQTAVNLGQPDYLMATTINAFNNISTNGQITNTYYDGQLPALSGLQTTLAMNNQRKRVSATTYTDTVGAAVKQATYYDYDIDGNVKTLWQQIDGLGTKRMDYEYDLVSGKVNFVRYQDNYPDHFYYRYKYDAENRLTEAWSGPDATVNVYTGSELARYNRKMDARYYYYLHGPLARVELGDIYGKVQGLDYAYTLQGWLKGVNSTYATNSFVTNDMGGDATTLSPTIPADAYAYGLYYYGNGATTLDYRTLDGSQPFDYGGLKTNQFSSLYNGNIGASSMVIPIPQFGIYSEFYQYRYDQLNRLTNTTHYSGFVGDTWINTPAYTEKFSYDANGNIKTAYRIGAGTNPIDNLNYKYTTDATGRIVNNRLNYITDAVSSSGLTTDLTNQAAGNYTYDAIGNLTADAQSGINAVNWNVYGKIQAITKSSGNLTYTYNSAQQRSSKTVGGVSTYYVRDAQGNTLAVYDNKGAAINWREQHLYGSSRLGMWTPNVRLGTDSSRAVWDTLGRKQYELSNHLGNVMATITDRRLQVHNSSGSEALLYLNADVSTAQQYYAFGGLQPGKTYTVNNAYRYGFNGKENDDDVKGTGNEQDYGMRIYDPRVGRFLSVDPLQKSYPYLTPYQFAENTPVQAVDLDGKEADFSKAKVDIIKYNKGDDGETKINTFVLNTVFKVYNGAVDMVEAGMNYNIVTNLIYGGKGYSKLYNAGKGTVAGVYNWTANTTWSEKKQDLKSLATNPHTYEDLAALVIAHKMIGPLAEAEAPKPIPSEVVDEGAGLSAKKAAQIRVNRNISRISETIVRERLVNELKEGQTLMVKPRIYINDAAGNATASYAAPDFAIVDNETGKIVKIVDAKNGNASLSTGQKALQENGGTFKGSSRATNAKPQKIAPNSIQVERTNISTKSD